ncbi:MAG: HPP family protein [Saprospiraceae bacterium]
MNPNTKVEDIMTSWTISVQPEDQLPVIQAIFKTHSFHHLPVINDDQKVVGMISKIDILHFMKQLSQETSGKFFSQKSIAHSTAGDIMTTGEIITIAPDDTVGLAADIFLANTIHSLPVVEDGKLAGIVTTHDLLKHAFKKVIHDLDE